MKSEQKTDRDIYFDTDIGSDVDDALALAYLVKSVKSRLKGVSTVYGPVETRAKAVGTLLDTMGVHSVDVVAGVEKPLSGTAVWTTGYEDYLVDMEIGVSPISLENYYASTSGDFDVLATGPLSNIALLLNSEKFSKRCKKLIIMGGSLNPDGWVPGVEHNFGSDSIAASKVLRSDIDIVLIPVDLTLRFPMTKTLREKFTKQKSREGTLLEAWIEKWSQVTLSFPEDSPFFNAVYFHDPIGAAYMTNPDLYDLKKYMLDVDNEGKIHVGSGKEISVVEDMNPQVIDIIVSTIVK